METQGCLLLMIILPSKHLWFPIAFSLEVHVFVQRFQRLPPLLPEAEPGARATKPVDQPPRGSVGACHACT